MALRTSGRIVTEDMKMIEETRNKIARDQINDFIDKMLKLGFQKEEIITLIRQTKGGEA